MIAEETKPAAATDTRSRTDQDLCTATVTLAQIDQDTGSEKSMKKTSKTGRPRTTAYVRRRQRSLGKLIAQRREAMGLTNTQLAEIIGIRRSTLCNIEAGRQSIQLVNIPEWINALNIKLTDLLKSIDV